MDRREEIIALQNELIREMTERRLKKTGEDLWGVREEKTHLTLTPEGSTPGAATRLDEIRKMTEENTRRLSELTKELGQVNPFAVPEFPVFGTPAPQQTPQNAPAVTEKTAQDAQTADDKNEETEKPESIDDLKKELHGYIGLNTIKSEVDSLINYVTIMQKRREQDLPTPDLSLHMVFSGDPGTGKTMVARLMSRIYKSLGLLSKGHLVETDRSGLVAGYVGQTAIKTQEVIEKALGGVLFIDEAYALTNHGENDYGQEAVDTLLKAMEDHRDDLIVIVAGYTELMEKFVNSNPGLKSRFNRFMHFPDYTLDEMMAIFDMRCSQSSYRLKDDEARDALRARIEHDSADISGFGNARGVRNLFERSVSAQADRLADDPDITKEELMLLTADDLRKAGGVEAENLSKPEQTKAEKDAEKEAEENA